jgi:hypothetical protein
MSKLPTEPGLYLLGDPGRRYYFAVGRAGMLEAEARGLKFQWFSVPRVYDDKIHDVDRTTPIEIVSKQRRIVNDSAY